MSEVTAFDCPYETYLAHSHHLSAGVNALHVHHHRKNLLRHVNENVCECVNENHHRRPSFAQSASFPPLSFG